MCGGSQTGLASGPVGAHPAGPFSFLARDMPSGHILGMAKARSTKPKAPRAEHPRLVGFSEDENTVVERAAELEGTKTNVFIREAALSTARRRLMPPAGGGR